MRPCRESPLRSAGWQAADCSRWGWRPAWAGTAPAPCRHSGLTYNLLVTLYLLAISEAAPTCIMFAATYPDRVRAPGLHDDDGMGRAAADQDYLLAAPLEAPGVRPADRARSGVAQMTRGRDDRRRPRCHAPSSYALNCRPRR